MLFVDIALIENICGMLEWKDLNKPHCTLINYTAAEKHKDFLLTFEKMLVWQFFFHLFTEYHKEKEGSQSYVQLSPSKVNLGYGVMCPTQRQFMIRKNI